MCLRTKGQKNNNLHMKEIRLYLHTNFFTRLRQEKKKVKGKKTMMVRRTGGGGGRGGERRGKEGKRGEDKRFIKLKQLWTTAKVVSTS